MKVLCITNLFPPAHEGGYEVICAGAMRHLVRSGHDVLVVTADRQPAAEDGDPRVGVRRELRLQSRNGWRQMTLRERYALERHNHRVFMRAVADHQPDLVTWWNMSGVSLGLLQRAARLGLPGLAMVCDWWPSYARSVDRWTETWSRHRWLRLPVERLSGLPTHPDVKSATDWAFISDHVRDQLLGGSLAGQDGPILRAGYDEELFRPREPRNIWDQRLLFVGRISPEKGVDTAIRTLAALPESYELSVIGGGGIAEFNDEVASLITELDLRERVHWHGLVDRAELPRHFAAADALLFPIRWPEPWGLVPLEALAVGVPVIGTISGGAGEYLQGDRNCLSCRSDDPDQIAEAVRRLAGCEQLRDGLREEGLATAARHTSAQFEVAFEDLCLDTVAS
ncbi:MAG: glycosyltransferase [Solirubrobacteraceae bacterium]